MKTNTYVLSLKTIFRLLVAACFFTVGSCLFADVVIVGSPSITDSSVSASDIEAIFLGKKKSLPSGKKIKIVTLKSGETHEAFLSNYVHKNPSQFSAFWKRKIVDGTGIPPKKFSSENELISFVISKDNVIGYVSTQTDLGGAKTLTIQ